MRLPRWTVFPALAVLAVFLVPAIPGKSARERTVELKAARAPLGIVVPAANPKHKRVIALGIDGADPEILREAIEKFPDHMTNWARLVNQGGLNELATSTPPQSPVAWSNFTTGMDPGGHGIFDFLHRDPMTRAVVVSTIKVEPGKHIELWNDWQLPIGGGGDSNRTGKAFWTILAEHGIPADISRMPANFPVEPAEGVSFSGMMTPAIDSAYGKCTLYSSDPPAKSIVSEDKIVGVREFDGVIETSIDGGENSFKKPDPLTGELAHVTAPLRIYVDRDSNASAIEAGGRVLVLKPGQWSDFVSVAFEPLPMGVGKYHGIVRFYLRRMDPELFELYASAVNIDPMSPRAPVSSPTSASADVAKAIGLYYTQGMPEDVNALKSKVLTDVEFMQQSDVVHGEGERMMDFALDRYLEKKDGGFLFFYYSGVDLCGHMMWRHHDAQHPNHDEAFAKQDSSPWSHRAGSTWKDVVYDLYMRMDPIIGRVLDRAGSDTLVMVMSDHGFKSYRRKFSLNTWLLDNGYLVLKPGAAREKLATEPDFAPVFLGHAVDWSKTRAYGVGFNGLYLNLAGRELDDPHTDADEKGIVKPGAEADALLRELKTKLEALVDQGTHVVVRCDLASECYHGPRTSEAPDILVGYNAGYGNSDEASLGRITSAVLQDNLGGTFNGSHLMAPDVVPGILLTNGVVLKGARSLEDLTVEILKQYGIEPGPGMRGKPVLR